MDYTQLAQKYGTPLYIYDFDYIKNRYESLKNEFIARKSLICYAVKANSNLSLLKMLCDLGAGFDCVSIGEVKAALFVGAKPYKIIYSGVGKSELEIKEAINLGILMINIESPSEMLLVEKTAKELNKKVNISIRVNPNIDPKTHPYISTGLSENKFGVGIKDAKNMYLYCKKSEFLEPCGVHFHIGSQLSDISPIIESANIVSDLVSELQAAEIDIKFFDVGGGIGIRYKDENEPNLYEYAQGILSALKGKDMTIVCEPGRFLVGNGGELLTKVIYQKTGQNGKKFIIVDGAMNDLIRPSLYQAHHEIIIPNLSDESKFELCDVVGPICESGDFLAKDIKLSELKDGDLLVVKSAGAYGFSMSSNYNSRPRAAEIALQNGKDRLIRQRESFEDLIKNQREFV